MVKFIDNCSILKISILPKIIRGMFTAYFLFPTQFIPLSKHQCIAASM